MTYSKKITNTVKGGAAFRQHNGHGNGNGHGQPQRPPTWGMGVRRWYGQPSPFAFPTNSSNREIRLFPRDQILLMNLDDIKELTPEVRMALSGRITPAEFRMMTPGIQLAWNPNVPRTPHIPFWGNSPYVARATSKSQTRRSRSPGGAEAKSTNHTHNRYRSLSPSRNRGNKTRRHRSSSSH